MCGITPLPPNKTGEITMYSIERHSDSIITWNIAFIKE